MSGLSDPLKYKSFFNQFGGEYDNSREIETYDNLQAEYAAIYGIPVSYYTINIDSYKDGMDPIYGENSTPVWDRKFRLTAITEQYSAEQLQWQGHGQVNIDEITIYIHRSTFDKMVGKRSLLAPAANNRRASFGPIAKDMVLTEYNGQMYEVITGGLHFLDSSAQKFGHKFWYKVTLKSREVSTAQVGYGEQYGALADMTLQQMIEAGLLDADGGYVCNPQAIVNTPCLPGPDNVTQTNPTTGGDDCPDYTTVGTNGRPLAPGEIPEDMFLSDGRLNQKYEVQGERPNSRHNDGPAVQKIADSIIDPQTNEIVGNTSRPVSFNSEGTIIYTDDGSVVPQDSTDYQIFLQRNKYSPGKVIRNTRDLWGDW